ncbi:aconitase family protein [Agriterribacter sp.]|uniref:aconitase family protein n=1 Tax=Agriterribacter sp. TaxID=2821509 RepID=UPI002B84CF94|nr:aconitase family protein [Agriterribacter sp.]HTN08266.1 aconitase family protein [Agriterribacter sp.]
MGKTLFDRIWDRHVAKNIAGGPSVLYVDKYFIHEVTSPRAFKGLQQRKRKVFRPKQVVAAAGHNVPTVNQHLPIKGREFAPQDDAREKSINDRSTLYSHTDQIVPARFLKAATRLRWYRLFTWHETGD